MSEFNFDKLKGIDIPDSWVSGALEVPKTSQTPPIIKRFPKTLAFVATLVIVCSLSVTLFIFTQKDNIQPTSNTTTPTSQTEANTTQEPHNTESNEDPTNNSISSESSEPTLEPEETQVEKTESTQTQTEKPTSTQAQEETKKPTQIPSQKPTQKPSQKPTQKPTLPPNPTELPLAPDSPSEPAIEEPSEVINTYYISVMAEFPKSLVTDSGKIYCKVSDSSGRLLGNQNLYANEHLTELSFIPYACARYYPYRYNLITKSGYYTFCFYNSDGVSVFNTTVYLTY